MIEGHAFVLVSLSQGLRNWNDYSRNENILFEEFGFAENVEDVINLIDGGNYVAVECTGFSKGDNFNQNFPEGIGRENGFLSFERSITAGKEQLTARPFEYAIDIATAQFSKHLTPYKLDLPEFKINPFKLLEPYTIAEANNFFGRTNEIAAVVENIEKYDLVFVHGETGIGKTSLLSAGVTGELTEKGKKVLQLFDYISLIENSKPNLDLPDNQNTIYILDHFESVFDLPVDEGKKQSFIKKLCDFQKTCQAKFIIATNTFEQTRSLFENLIEPDKVGNVEIGLLSEENAGEIIVRSLENNGFEIHSNNIKKLVIPELERLNSESKEFIEDKGIYPPLLQIVCYKLVETAKECCNSIIGDALFKDQYKSAENILKNHIEEQLKSLFRVEKEFEQAIQVLVAILTSDIERWFSTRDLLIRDQNESFEIEPVLEKLTKLDLLVKKKTDSANVYSLAGAWVFIMINLIADEKLKYQNLARIEMRSAWKSWIISGSLASAKQVETLSSYSKILQLEPTELLFLLRSAVENKSAAKPLLDAFLETEQLRNFAARLEADSSEITGTNLHNTMRLLDYSATQTENGNNLKMIPLSQNAVSNESAQARQTSALLLTIDTVDKEIKDRLFTAFGKIKSKIIDKKKNGLNKIRLLAETRGIISETYPDIDSTIKYDGLGFIERFAVSLWLIRRQIIRNSEFIFKAILFSGLLFGLGLGIFKALIAFLLEIPPGVELFLALSISLILGAGFAFGIVISGCFLNTSIKHSLSEMYTSDVLSLKESLFISLGGASSLFITQIVLRQIQLLNNSPTYASNEIFYLNEILLWAVTSFGAGTGYFLYYRLQKSLGKFAVFAGVYISSFTFALMHYFIIIRSKEIIKTDSGNEIKFGASLLHIFQPDDYKKLSLGKNFEDLSSYWFVYCSVAEAAFYGLFLFLYGLHLATMQ